MRKYYTVQLAIIVILFSSWKINREKFYVYETKYKRAFTFGEKLKFKIGIGFIDAGYAEFEVKPYKNDSSYFHIVGKGYSNKTFDWFFKIRDRYETIIDSATLCPLEFIRSVEEGNASFKQHYIFDHNECTVFDGKDTMNTCDKIQDMMSCYFFARNMDFKNIKKGEIFSFPTFVDGEIFTLKIKFLGREDITIDTGKFRALKFCPIVQTGRIFNNEESLSVWISDDYNKIPLLIKAHIWFGSISMEVQQINGIRNKISRII